MGPKLFDFSHKPINIRSMSWLHDSNTHYTSELLCQSVVHIVELADFFPTATTVGVVVWPILDIPNLQKLLSII